MDRKFDALAQRMDAIMKFNTQFSAMLSQIFASAGSSSDSVQFPVPLDIPDYPPNSPDEEGDVDA